MALTGLAGCLDEPLEGDELGELGEIESEVVNGSTSGSSPSTDAVVSLVIGSSITGWSGCTGTLVSPNTILTAGHCIPAQAKGNDLFDGYWHRFRANVSVTVRIGPNPATAVTVRGSYASYPPMLPGGGHDDIALIGLDEPVASSVAIPRAIAFDNPGITSSSRFAVYGYGGTPVRAYTMAGNYNDESANYWWVTPDAPATGTAGDSGGPLFYGSTAGPLIGVVQRAGGQFGGVKTFGRGVTNLKPDIRAWLLARSGQQDFAQKGWVWSAAATGSGNLGSTYYTHNSSGGTNTVENIGVGWYKVSFPGIAMRTGGFAQASAYGSGSERCGVLTHLRSAGATANVYVLCHDAAGNAVNTQFVASFTGKDHLESVGGALLADQQTTASYVPDDQFNSNELVNYINRIGTGQYQVTINGQLTGGNTQVTAYGVSDGSYCKLVSVGGSPLTIVVRCYTAAGALADRKFMIQYDRGGTYGASGFARAHRETVTSWYAATSSFALGGGINWARTTSTGRHRVLFEDRGTAGSGALVTAYGANSVYCKPAGWGTSSEQGGGVNLNVSCFAAGGSPSSSQFEAQFMTPE